MKNSSFLLDELLMTRYLGLNNHGLNDYTCLITDINRRVLNVYRRLKMGVVAENQRVWEKGGCCGFRGVAVINKLHSIKNKW